MPVISISTGAQRSPYNQLGSVVVGTRIAGTSAKVLWSQDAGLGGARTTASAAVDPLGNFFTLDRLTPGQRYHGAVEVDGVVDLAQAFQFDAFPEERSRASYRFQVFCCFGYPDAQDARWTVGKASNTPLFDIMGERPSLFWLCLGDRGYNDTNSAAIATYRDFLALQMAQPRQQAYYKRRSGIYWRDDHETNNDSIKTHPGTASFNQAYRETIPNYVADWTIGALQAWVVGRDLHIMPDLRTFRDNPADSDTAAKTIMGLGQEAAVQALIAQAAASYHIDDLCLHSTTPTIGTTNADGSPLPDHWARYPHCRDRLAGWLAAFRATGKATPLTEGDIHALRFDSGTNSPLGCPTFGTGALDCTPNFRGGPYDYGSSQGSGRFMEMSVDYLPGGKRIRGEGRIWHSAWRAMDVLSPAGFLPSSVAA